MSKRKRGASGAGVLEGAEERKATDASSRAVAKRNLDFPLVTAAKAWWRRCARLRFSSPGVWTPRNIAGAPVAEKAVQTAGAQRRSSPRSEVHRTVRGDAAAAPPRFDVKTSKGRFRENRRGEKINTRISTYECGYARERVVRGLRPPNPQFDVFDVRAGEGEKPSPP